MSITPTFSGEVQLAGWRESHTSGATITLWLSDPADLDVFRVLTARKGNTAGQRFMAARVEIGDDEQPVADANPPQEPGRREKPKGGPLARLAGQWCNSAEFVDWIRVRYDIHMGGDGSGCGDVSMDGPEGGRSWYARHAICVMCLIESRAELDHDDGAAERFHRLIRAPFAEYLRNKEAGAVGVEAVLMEFDE